MYSDKLVTSDARQMLITKVDSGTPADGRVTGTATTQASGGTTQTQYRDASGRSAGSATTHGYASGSSRTTYRDASGRSAGSADTSKFAGSSSWTQFRDASGRSAGSETTNGCNISGLP